MSYYSEWNGRWNVGLSFIPIFSLLLPLQLPCFSDRGRVAPIDVALLDKRPSCSLNMSQASYSAEVSVLCALQL